jgi:hypothetical protein
VPLFIVGGFSSVLVGPISVVHAEPIASLEVAVDGGPRVGAREMCDLKAASRGAQIHPAGKQFLSLATTAARRVPTPQ